MAEKQFDSQVNYSWNRTFNLTEKVPAVNKRIFDTLADAQAFADDIKDSAIEGLLLSVVSDTEDKNGVYFVKSVKKTSNGAPSVLSKVGENEGEVEGTSKILCSREEPPEEYRNYLWLQETDDEVITDDQFQIDIRSMQRAILELTKIVKRHEYAFSNTMNCGTVTENSTRQDLMSSSSPEAPDGYFDGTTPVMVAHLSSSKTVESINNYYLSSSLNYGVDLKSDGWNDILPSLDETNKYLWNYASINFNNSEVKSTEPEVVNVYNSARVIDKVVSHYAINSSGEEYPEKDSNLYGEHIPDFDEKNPYLWRYISFDYVEDINANKPNYNGYGTANVKHLVIKSAQTEQEIRENLNNILNDELIWCEGNNGLYIKSKNKLVKINGSSGSNSGGSDDDGDNEIDEIMSGITFINDGVAAIDFISSKGNKYTMDVTDEGKLRVYNYALNEPHPAPTGTASGSEGGEVSDLFLQKLYINSLYCGGEIDANGKDINEHSLNRCSHNFVELSNLTNEDINLNGLSLQYASNGTNWKVLPLWGVIKAKSTFLIRGAQCSIMNHNTTVIKVKDYDMEWLDESGNPIKFSDKSAKFYLRYGLAPCDVANPYLYNDTNKEYKFKYGYIDLVGLASDATNVPGGQENKVYQELNSNRLFMKYYAMDNVIQATKAKDKRNNKSDWYYVDLTRDDILPNVECYTPRASSYGKNIFYNKTELLDMKPTICTVTFGIQATDNGSGATRCFNWVSKGYYDEFLWYRKKGTTVWNRVESYKDETDDIKKYYNRIQQEASNGDVFTTHKIIVKGLTSGTYEYTCGKSLKDNNPNMDACIEVREFKVRSNSEVSSFKFIQVSDQQGFNWDEYQVWGYAADFISKNETPEFLINTGDMTQNGNRLNEWIDYFNAKHTLNNLEEMATIGNNDLCPKIVYNLGDGGDASKINFANINFFYTFEMDETNPPIFGEGATIYGYIPSIYSFNYGDVHFMCVNSEIAEKTTSDIFGLEAANKGVIYAKIKEWCEKDIQKYSGYTWNIAYCHEMPFTIITDSLMSDFYNTKDDVETSDSAKRERGGSRINTVTTTENKYWFSKFCQENSIRLVMGGHKHTQAITWPIKENSSESMKPIIQVTASDLAGSYFNNSTHLITITDDGDLKGYSYPNKWFTSSKQSSTTATRNDIDATYKQRCHFCTYELVTAQTAPVYSMSQATGYKHTSNRELPAKDIPWCRHYYPNNSGSANANQKHPFYTVYNVTSDNITIDVKRLKNIMNSGSFNINVQGEELKKGTITIVSENGLSSSTDATSSDNVIITK